MRPCFVAGVLFLWRSRRQGWAAASACPGRGAGRGFALRVLSPVPCALCRGWRCGATHRARAHRGGLAKPVGREGATRRGLKIMPKSPSGPSPRALGSYQWCSDCDGLAVGLEICTARWAGRRGGLKNQCPNRLRNGARAFGSSGGNMLPGEFTRFTLGTLGMAKMPDNCSFRPISLCGAGIAPPAFGRGV